MRLMEKRSSKIKTYRSLSLTYFDVIVGSFEDEIDLFNYVLILRKSSCGVVDVKKHYLP